MRWQRSPHAILSLFCHYFVVEDAALQDCIMAGRRRGPLGRTGWQLRIDAASDNFMLCIDTENLAMLTSDPGSAGGNCRKDGDAAFWRLGLGVTTVAGRRRRAAASAGAAGGAPIFRTSRAILVLSRTHEGSSAT
jgi:hypothetical protein